MAFEEQPDTAESGGQQICEPKPWQSQFSLMSSH